MNTTTAYENLIAAKLEQLPVPDMADSIWASIELQLDAPADAPAKKDAIKKPGKGWYGFFGTVVIVVILLLYYHQKNTKKNTIPAPTPSPVINTNNAAPDSVPLLKDPAKNTPAANPPLKKDSTIPPADLGRRINFDTLAPSLPHTKADSMPALINRPNLPVFEPVNIAPPSKKPKGVKGISDTSYRIYGQKDTGRKG